MTQVTFTGIRQLPGNTVEIEFNMDLIDPVSLTRANVWRVTVSEALERGGFPVTLSGPACNLVIYMAEDGCSRWIRYAARYEAEASSAVRHLQSSYRIPASA